mmetsp:Transcript_9342/g.17865  ORF Transcript_9342/g.17865 Transcript_9342/m.17865 type:complete len:125 (-) Transcript_9342:37-411(-)
MSSKLQQPVAMLASPIIRILMIVRTPPAINATNVKKKPTSAQCVAIDKTPAPIAALQRQMEVARSEPSSKLSAPSAGCFSKGSRSASSSAGEVSDTPVAMISAAFGYKEGTCRNEANYAPSSSF